MRAWARWSNAAAGELVVPLARRRLRRGGLDHEWVMPYTRSSRLSGGKEMQRMNDPLPKRLGAEFLGTFVLVFGGCGTAVITANFGRLASAFWA